ncbi:MAG: nucleotidyltransferase domain-containing protein, partial [Nitrospira sp.]|nr:nucleotidyltransferase domain-containing protein [Nitrospira sp.]
MIKDAQTRYQQAQEAAEACIRVLKEQFGVREVYVFGSLAGQSPWHSRSDIDLAVEGLPPKEYIRALSTLWELLPEGLELDLITLEDA